MMKADEILLLDKTIAKFGPNSYLGPWLSEIRLDLVTDIGNDVTPNALMPSKARAEALRIIANAKVEADAIREKASADALRTLDNARTRYDAMRQEARRSLERLIANL